MAEIVHELKTFEEGLLVRLSLLRSDVGKFFEKDLERLKGLIERLNTNKAHEAEE